MFLSARPTVSPPLQIPGVPGVYSPQRSPLAPQTYSQDSGGAQYVAGWTVGILQVGVLD